MLIQLCRVVAKLNSPIEAAKFLKDILTAQEAEMLAKRLKVAERLMAGDTYAKISFDFKISPSTIFRIHEWLKISGDGFRLGLAKIEKEKFNSKYFNDNFDSSWRDLKKKFPIYFWPQILLESVVRSAGKRDKQRLAKVLNKMEKKSRLYKRLYRLLNK
ncbi:hypothetical protein KJ590_00800 [Patescibacteria group bacterium]|nr:hypothetical protein [Patescibacteria group bacterium]